MTFDEVIPTLIGCVEHELDSMEGVSSARIVRDLRGRVRLALDDREPIEVSTIGALTKLLEARLGLYFVAPILTRHSGDVIARIARRVLGLASTRYKGTAINRETSNRSEPTLEWRVVERRLSKLHWLGQSFPEL